METLAEFLAIHALGLVLGLAVAVAGLLGLILHVFSRYRVRIHGGLAWGWCWLGGERLTNPVRRRHPRLYRFLTRRISLVAYLGLNIALGLALLLAGVALLGPHMEDISAREDVVRFDRILVAALDQHASDRTLQVFTAVTRLGDEPALAVIAALGTLVLLLRRHWTATTAWVVTMTGGALLNLLLKELIRRDRPEVAQAVLDAPGWAFPSGHAMGATIAYGMLAYLFLRLGHKHWASPVLVFTVALVLLIGASRVVLQVHYFSDVVAGFIAGIGWLLLCIVGTELALRRSTSSYVREDLKPGITPKNRPEEWTRRIGPKDRAD